MSTQRHRGTERVEQTRTGVSAGAPCVLVGTYWPEQMQEWVLPKGYYNYPVRAKDEEAIPTERLAHIKELWLYNHKTGRTCFAAEFVHIATKGDPEFAGYPTGTKQHGAGDKYFLFKVKPLDRPSAAMRHAPVVVRLADFAHDDDLKAGIKKVYLGGKSTDEEKSQFLGRLLPADICKCGCKRLKTCPKTLQLELWCTGNRYSDQLCRYLEGEDVSPLFLCGESLSVLRQLPSESFDCCMTSPPYWNKRQYKDGGIGLEGDYRTFIDNLLAVFAEIKRVLKPTGSFWLNIGDSYLDKNLLNIPSRIAIRMQDEQGWVLRNTVIWNKVKGCPDNSEDKLRNIYEPVFHFVKRTRGYYYDIDSVRNKPHEAKVVNGAVVSATGVSGVRYKRKIEMSTNLTLDQKNAALSELDAILRKVQDGEVSDFRMIIKGGQRTTHSDSERVSGRARELHERGFYFLKYNPKGTKPSDLWDIIPEDTQGRETHFAPYPEDLCKMPILLTCPPGGVVLDPFSGTGTTAVVACSTGRKSVGIDISKTYVEEAEKRVKERFAQGEFDFVRKVVA